MKPKPLKTRFVVDGGGGSAGLFFWVVVAGLLFLMCTGG